MTDNIKCDEYYNKFDELIIKKDNEINEIIENKKKSVDDKDNESLSYDVKKILSKQKTHDKKRKEKSKSHQKGLVEDFEKILGAV
jgi:hypothetical protein